MAETPTPTDQPAARLVLIGCTASKRATRARARDLYDTSQLFIKRRRYAEQSGHQWAIVSALHGFVDPDTELDPYDVAIGDHRRRGIDSRYWGTRVVQEAFRHLGIGASVKPGDQFATWDRPLVIEVHAGAPYVEALEQGSARMARVHIEHPVAGLQIGETLSYYNRLAA